MTRSPTARRYARALFDLAQEQGRLDAVQADLAEIARLAGHRETYERLLQPYELSARDRKAIWDGILGGRADPLTHRFVHFLVDKRRGPLLGPIILEFQRLYLDTKGITAVEVRTARPLTEEQLQALANRLAARLDTKIKATQKADPALLGGFQVWVGDVVYDYSIHHQLELLHQKFVTA